MEKIVRVKPGNGAGLFLLRSLPVFLVIFIFLSAGLKAQVSVSATAGLATGTYSTLKSAFDAINAGTHQGAIQISINSNLDEGTTPAVLNSRDADPCSYTSVIIRPTADNITITCVPPTGRGVIELNGADNVTINGDNAASPGTNRDLSINNNATSSVVGGSCVRIATSTVNNSADNNSVINCKLNGNVASGNAAGITSIATSSNLSYGIYVGGNASTTMTGNPLALTSAMEAAPASVSIRNSVFQNNEIGKVGRAIMFNTVNAAVSNSLIITQNDIGTTASLGTHPYTSPATTVYQSGIWVAGTTAVSITQNNIQNVISYLTGIGIAGIELNSSIGTGTVTISNNIINGVSSNTLGSNNSVTGILVNSVSAAFTISGNSIRRVDNLATVQPAAGIRINSAGGIATISENAIGSVFNRQTGGSSGGILLSNAANGALIRNNFVYDIMNKGTTSFAAPAGCTGIGLYSGNNHRVYHNSVYLYGSSGATGTNIISCLALAGASQTGTDIRNNIFANKVTGGVASNAHVCLYFPLASSPNYNIRVNNNAYFCGTTAGQSGIAYGGNNSYNVTNLYTGAAFNPTTTTGAGNWRSFTAGLGYYDNDYASYGSTGAVPFISGTDLHITPATTPIESGGTALSVSQDIDGDSRSSASPDMGADEFTGTAQDIVGPDISYNPLINTCSTGSRQLTATITDFTGVSVTSLPVLYWSVNGGPFTDVTAIDLGSDQYQFVFGNGVNLGDVITYYIAAQDQVGNVSVSPSVGAAGFSTNPPAASTPPTTLSSYNIQSTLAAGTYDVGVGQTYTTITEAIDAYNNSCPQGAIVFRLMDASYPSETFPITIGNPYASSVNTLTIIPNAGVAVNLNGNDASAIFKLDGADYVTIDGLNSGGSSLSITNTNGSGVVIWMASASATNGATHNTISNCTLRAGGNSTSPAVIFSGSGAALGSAAQSANSDNSYTDNKLYAALDGIFIFGVPNTSNQNLVISGNTIGSASVNADKMGSKGIEVRYASNFTISSNIVAGVTSATVAPVGIGLYNTVTNGVVSQNKISDISQTTSVAGSYGLWLQSSSGSSSVQVVNNFIWNVSAGGSSTLANNSFGIFVGGGGGYSLLFNSVLMSVNQTDPAGVTAALRISSTVTSINTLDIRNNIFSNTATVGTRYALYNASASTVFGTTDYNIYFTNSTSVLNFQGGTRANLGEWQAVTGKDIHSMVANPQFTSSTNLHLATNSPANGIATSIAAITTDIDGDTRNATTDIGADEVDAVNCSGLPAGGTLTASTIALCSPGPVAFTVSGFAVGDNLVYQWQSSTNNFTTATDIAGATTPSNYYAPNVTGTTYFRLKILCTLSGQTNYSNVITVTVSSPVITSTTAATRCGSGTVSLSATSVTAGASIKWYAAPSGGAVLATGTNFTTPVINNTTTFYAGASLGNNVASAGPISPSDQGGAIGTQLVPWEVYFDVLQPTTLISVDVYPMISGASASLSVKDAAGANIVTVNYTTSVSGGATPQTVTLNAALAIGTGFYLSGTIPNGGIRRNESGASYPYNSAALNIVGNNFSASYFMGYYNWKFTTVCESVRTPVIATVTTAPLINATASVNSICSGGTSVLTASSANAGYSYVWTPGNIPGASTGVSPTTSTTYTVRGTDASGGANNGCSTTKTVTITVRPNPAAVTVTPNSGSVCASGSPLQLTASNGLLTNVVAYSDNFNTVPSNWTNLNNSSDGIIVNAAWTQKANGYIYHGSTFNSNDLSRFFITNSDAQGSGSVTNTILTSPAIDLTGFTTATLNFFHHLTYVGGETAIVEISSDGSNWNSIPGGTYSGSVGTPANFVNAALNIDAYVGAPIFVRFRYEASWDGWWAIDNVSVTGSMTNTYTWTQVPVAPASIFTDAIGVTPYVDGTPSTSVWVLPPVNTQYIVKSSGPAPTSCSSTTTANITVTPPPTVTVAHSANPVCPGTTVTFTAVTTNAGPSPTYQWQVNGANVGTNSSTYSYIPSDLEVITVNIISNGACSNGVPVTSPPDTMHVTDAVPVTVTVSANPGAEVCENTPVTFTANVGNGGTTTTYVWRINGGIVGTNSPTYSYTPTYLVNNGDAVTCTVTSNSGCILGPSTVTSPQLLMTVRDIGNVGVTVGTSYDNNTVCTGTQVTVVATPLHPGNSPVYEFYLNNVPQTPQASNNYTFTPVNGDKVKVRLTSNYGCLLNPLNTQATSNTITLTVLAVSPVSVSLDHSNALCSGIPITFTANPTNPGAAPVYDFLLNGGVVQSSNSPTYTLNAPANGNTVQVQLNSNRACITGNPALSSIYTVSLNPGPTVSTSATCTNLLGGSGQLSVITATATAGSGSIDTYQWFMAPATPVGTNSPTFSTNTPGSYYVVVSNTNGCAQTTQGSPIIVTNVTTPLAGGTYYIPGNGCNGFETIASAVKYINSYGVGGPVTFAIAPGFAETAPEGGYSIRATGTATNTITFDRDGAGANPIITASLQFPAKNNDGIFKIIGGDYITIRNLELRENPANTVVVPGPTNTMTEWGIALLYATPTNGPSNNTIENNIISLNKTYPNSFGIYSNMRHDSVSVETLADLSNSSAGFNKVYSNTITDVNIPIYFQGAPGANASVNNDIGGSSATTGNIISNWGTNTSPNTGGQLYGVPSSLQGIAAINQANINISWNSITNTAGMNNGTAGLYGIKTDFTTAAPTANFTNVIGNNNIALNSSASAANASVISILAANTMNVASIANGQLQISNNTLSTNLTASSGASNLVNISNLVPFGIVSFNGNKFLNNNSAATTGGYTGILNNAFVTAEIHADNNQFGSSSSDAVKFSVANNATIKAVSVLQTATSAAITVNGNSFGYIHHEVTGTGNITLVDIPVAGASLQVNNNQFTNLNLKTTGNTVLVSSPVTGASKSVDGNTFSGIISSSSLKLVEIAGGTPATTVSNNILGGATPTDITAGSSFAGFDLLTSASGSVTVASNQVSGITMNGASASGYWVRSNTPAVNINYNSISSISATGNNANLKLISIETGAAGISFNTINDVSVTGNALPGLTAIAVAGTGNSTIFKNKIHSLSANNVSAAASPVLRALQLSGGTSVIVHNNFISNLNATSASGTDIIRAIDVNSTLANSNCRLYFNSIYLTASSTGSDFGTSAIYHLANSTSSTAALDLRNNIIDNESVAAGTGITAALRRSSSDLSNFGSASNYNAYFAGQTATPGALYYDGSSTVTDLVSYQALVAGRDVNSFNAKPVFTSATDLHLLTSGNCAFESNGIPIAGLTDDIDFDTRSTTKPDIGADEFAGTGGGAGVWAGVSTNWMDPANWCGAVPTSTTDVLIPTGAPLYPIINSLLPEAANITIQPGASVKINSTGQLTIHGSITNNGSFDVASGTIELAGSSAQNIPASVFDNDDLGNLIINNSSVSLDGNLKLYGKLSFKGSNRTFATNDHLVLRSTVSGTASVGDLTNAGASSGNSVSGNVSVERFISARRAWRLLSVPTMNNLQTIHEAWQEGMAANSTAQTSPAGYGIHLTKDSANWSAYGFDLQTPAGPSIKTYIPATNGWKAVTSTIDVPGVSNGRFETGVGYMTIIRGDRTVNSFPQAATTTTIRDKGQLVQGNYTGPAVPAGLFQVIGNPYASAVDFTRLNKTNLDDVYYLWDPQIGSLGGYVTFAGPAYVATSSLSYQSGNKQIESGQAFFVHSSGSAGSVEFVEPSKADGSNLVSRVMGNSKSLRTNLYATLDNQKRLFDGNLVEFDAVYSNVVDGKDAIKPVNSGENLGLKRNGRILSVERHAEIVSNDTIFYNLTQVRATNYRFEFVPENMDPLLTGYLMDRYLNTSTVVSMVDTTKIDFTVVNEPGSYAADRFYLVFKRSAPVPVTFINVKAERQNRNNLVSWQVAHEDQIGHYEVERSGTGNGFAKVHEELATGSSNYQWLDIAPLSGDNYYRIKAVGVDNDIKYSQIVKLSAGKGASQIAVYPNPVKDDRMLYVDMQNKEAGKYQVQLLNEAGQVIMNEMLNHQGGSSIYNFRLPAALAHGNYILQVGAGEQKRQQFKIVY